MNPIKRSYLFPTFIASLVLFILPYTALASLKLELRATSKTVSGVTTSNLGGSASNTYGAGVSSVSGLHVGDKVTFTLFAYAHSELNNPEDGDPNSDGTTNFQGFESAFGYITQSVAGLSGTWSTFVNPNHDPAGGVNLINALKCGSNGAQAGKIQDLNADGFQDIGSNSTDPGDTNLIFARRCGLFSTNITNVPTVLSPDGLTTQFLVGTCTITITSVTSTSPSSISWNNPPSGFTGTAALWEEDGVMANVVHGGTLLSGSAVTLTGSP